MYAICLLFQTATFSTWNCCLSLLVNFVCPAAHQTDSSAGSDRLAYPPNSLKLLYRVKPGYRFELGKNN